MNVAPQSEAPAGSLPRGVSKPKRGSSDGRLFWLTVAISTVAFLPCLAMLRNARVKSYRTFPSIQSPRLVPVSEHIAITAQLQPNDIPILGRSGINTIVDIRPDGEATGQPSSKGLAKIAEKNLIEFHYIPVPHETIPEEAVQKLRDVLADPAGRTVLYCRTGRRAVRLFALVEASRPGGPDSKAILDMVRKAGFSAIDLKDDIARRISQRSDAQPGGN
jgi:uncharacterized protein (TIGR01244 family)